MPAGKKANKKKTSVLKPDFFLFRLSGTFWNINIADTQ